MVESEAVEFCFEVIGGEPRLMFTRDGGQLVLSLRTEDGLIYQIEQATALNGPWTAEGAAFIGTGRLKTVGVAADNASRFLRVRSETP